MASGFIKSVIEVAHVDFSLYDIRNHALLYTSGLAAELLGYSVDEMKEFGKEYNRAIIHPGDICIVESKMEELENAVPGQIIESTVRYKKKNGKYLWGYTRKIVSEWDDNRKPVKITVIAEDVTDLVLLKKELDMRVTQLEQISYTNAHELRGPVASILGLANLMSDEGLINDYHKDILCHLTKAVQKLDSIVSDLVHVSGEGENGVGV